MPYLLWLEGRWDNGESLDHSTGSLAIIDVDRRSRTRMFKLGERLVAHLRTQFPQVPEYDTRRVLLGDDEVSVKLALEWEDKDGNHTTEMEWPLLRCAESECSDVIDRMTDASAWLKSEELFNGKA